MYAQQIVGRERNQRVSYDNLSVTQLLAAASTQPLAVFPMLLDDEEQHDKRLNRVAYANVGLGLLTLFLWAIPGPGMVPTFWQYIDRDFHSTSEPVVAKIGMALKVVIVLVVVQFWLLSLISLANGFLILKRRRYRLCMIFSGVSLLGTPFHLVLGIISLVTLGNDWARKRFANGRRSEHVLH